MPDVDLREANLRVQVGATLRAARENAGASLKDVATRAGIQPPTLHDIETGRSNMTLERLERIADAYGFAVGFVVAPKPKEVPSV